MFTRVAGLAAPIVASVLNADRNQASTKRAATAIAAIRFAVVSRSSAVTRGTSVSLRRSASVASSTSAAATSSVGSVK